MATQEQKELAAMVLNTDLGSEYSFDLEGGDAVVFLDNHAAWYQGDADAPFLSEELSLVGASEEVLVVAGEIFPQWIGEEADNRDKNEFSTNIQRDLRVAQPDRLIF